MADKNTDYKDVTLPHGTKGYGNSDEEALQDAIDNQNN